ncbi:SafA/ExsA family spore coat assembly protein [Paraliobacillus salinarum]|uniref:SafA/ExsA family spore coat assembly protein n=1 Tax=Paraliobacillus salinarum TaxID=1158996 RepID=UPI0015F64BE2|nr:SafA/ExsA family spore coat assembly protein [Paraliobacillus salinarum]
MKIHIVQKGDTLWKLAEKYDVDFEALKQMNAQLANPGMIMPGMKIKIPSSNNQVQKQPTMDKTIHPYKNTSPKAMPVVKEDDKKTAPVVKKEMPKPTPKKEVPMQPVQPIQMPSLPDFYSNQYNIDVDIEDNDTEINQYAFHHQMNQQPAQQQPVQQPVQKPVQQPMMPICYMMPPCMPMYPMPHPQPIMYPMHATPNQCDHPVDPCETFQSPQQWMHNQEPTMPSFYQGEEQMESSSVEMPPLPNQSMAMQQPSQQMPYGDWSQNMQQAPMWSPQQQSPMQQAPYMGEQGPGMPHQMMHHPPYQPMPFQQPGMPMPNQGNINPYQQQSVYPYRESCEENE